MPLRSLRARLVLLLLASSALAAILFALRRRPRSSTPTSAAQALKGLHQRRHRCRAGDRGGPNRDSIGPGPAVGQERPRDRLAVGLAAVQAVLREVRERAERPPGDSVDRSRPRTRTSSTGRSSTRPKQPAAQSIELRIDGKRYVGIAVALRFSHSKLATVRGVTRGRGGPGPRVELPQDLGARPGQAARPVLHPGAAVRAGAGPVHRPPHHAPVKELSEASERIASGMYDIELRTHGRDELGTLAARFQLMARKLKEADELERQLPDARLARAAHPAHGDPGPRPGAGRRHHRRPRRARRLAARSCSRSPSACSG